MAVSVRYATVNDARLLAVLGAKTFYDTFHAENTEEDMQAYIQKAYSEDTIGQLLTDNNIQYAIAFEGDEPIGYTKLLLNATHEKLSGRNIELEKIYVLQSKIGTGAGRLLMEEAIRYSAEHQYDNLFLGVWQENKRAVDFYHKAQFEIFATRSFQLGSRLCEDYIMKRVL